MSQVENIKPWEVVEFPWGTAIRHVKGKWQRLFLFPNGQEIDVSKHDVILHDNGIEFLNLIMR